MVNSWSKGLPIAIVRSPGDIKSESWRSRGYKFIWSLSIFWLEILMIAKSADESNPTIFAIYSSLSIVLTTIIGLLVTAGWITW